MKLIVMVLAGLLLTWWCVTIDVEIIGYYLLLPYNDDVCWWAFIPVMILLFDRKLMMKYCCYSIEYLLMLPYVWYPVDDTEIPVVFVCRYDDDGIYYCVGIDDLRVLRRWYHCPGILHPAWYCWPFINWWCCCNTYDSIIIDDNDQSMIFARWWYSVGYFRQKYTGICSIDMIWYYDIDIFKLLLMTENYYNDVLWLMMMILILLVLLQWPMMVNYFVVTMTTLCVLLRKTTDIRWWWCGDDQYSIVDEIIPFKPAVRYDDDVVIIRRRRQIPPVTLSASGVVTFVDMSVTLTLQFTWCLLCYWWHYSDYSID